MTGRQRAPFGAKPARDPFRTAIGCLCAAALLSMGACADIWGFHDLAESPAAGGSGGERAIRGSDPAGETGAGGVVIPIDDAGSSGQFGGSSGGSGGMSGTGGVRGGAGGTGGQAGVSGSAGTGAGGPVGSGGVSDGGGGVDADGAAGSGGQGGAETGVTPETGVCVPGTNRCMAGDLETCVATGAWQSTGTAPARELLSNPAFEQGETGWMVFVAGGFPIVYAANGRGASGTPDIAAQSPPNVTWIGGYNRADDSITQSIVLPADPASMTLSFYYAVTSRETSVGENDVMDVELLVGAQTISLAHFNDAPVDTWTPFSAPLPSTLAGQTVALRFHGTTNANAITSFYVDTVSVQVVSCP